MSARTKPEEDAEPVVMPSPALWQLHAKPDFVTDSARAWQELGRVSGTTDADVARAAEALLAGWKGQAALSYDQHRHELAKGLTVVSTVAGAVGEALHDAADTLRRAQADLDASWRSLQAAPRTWESIRGATTEAQYIRVRARIHLNVIQAEIRGLRSKLWVHEVAGTINDPVESLWSTAPELAAAGRVIVDGQRVIVNGSGIGDTIEVGVLPSTGEQYVTVNGVRRYFPADAQIVVRAGGGADTVRLVSPSSSGSPRVTVLGGSGRDIVHGSEGADLILGGWDQDEILGYGGADLIYGGSDDDYISGGAGDDRLDAGAGEDTAYGLDGQDRIWGGHGEDMIDGGRGHDAVRGGRGDDVLFGGADSDGLWGEGGNDAMFVGDWGDSRMQVADGGTGFDSARVYDIDEAYAESQTRAELPPPIGHAVVVDPNASAEFRARAESDLEALRSTESGAEMLAALQGSHDQHGDIVMITETDDRPTQAGGSSDVPVRATIAANPSYTPIGNDGLPMRPVVQLQHELAHTYDDFYDSEDPFTHHGGDNDGVPNRERVATGLPIDDDGFPWTSDRIDPDHPYVYTENALRDELGLPRRPRYG